MEKAKWRHSDGVAAKTGPPPYSTDIDEAEMVVDKLRQNGWTVTVKPVKPKNVDVTEYECNISNVKESYSATERTEAVAICVATLACLKLIK